MPSRPENRPLLTGWMFLVSGMLLLIAVMILVAAGWMVEQRARGEVAATERQAILGRLDRLDAAHARLEAAIDRLARHIDGTGRPTPTPAPERED